MMCLMKKLQGNYMKLVKRTEIEKPDKVYNLHIKNNNNYIANDIVVSNCHGVRGQILRDLLQECPNARFRFGFTGTMPHDPLDCLQVQSYIGPVLREYGASKLAKMGYVAEAFIKMVHVDYKIPPKGDYNEIKDIVFNNPYRQGIIKDIIKNSDGNVLVLVGKVSDEGDLLKDILSEDESFSDYEIEFLSGRDSAVDREKWRKSMDETGQKVITINFGDIMVKVDPDTYVPLSNGLFKKACDITIEDDISDDWVSEHSSVLY